MPSSQPTALWSRQSTFCQKNDVQPVPQRADFPIQQNRAVERTARTNHWHAIVKQMPRNIYWTANQIFRCIISPAVLCKPSCFCWDKCVLIISKATLCDCLAEHTKNSLQSSTSLRSKKILLQFVQDGTEKTNQLSVNGSSEAVSIASRTNVRARSGACFTPG